MTPGMIGGKPQAVHSAPAFFHAILPVLRFLEPDTRPLAQLTDNDWHELLAFADLAHLTIPLVSAAGNQAPAWVQARVEQNLADNRLRVRRIGAAYAEIAKELDEAGVPHLVMKGFAQYPDFAPSLESRMQSDIDLYCPEECLPAAQAVLIGLGYKGDPTLAKYPADHLPEMSRKGSWQWRGNAYDPEMPPSVDLHFCFWNFETTRISIPGVQAFWPRRIEQRRNDFGFPALSRLDNLAYSALHILRDLLRGDWVLHHVYELAWFLHTHAEDEAMWQSWQVTHDDSLRSLQAISFYLARDWFHCRCAAPVDCEILAIAKPVREWLERFSGSTLSGMFRPNKDGVWLHLALAGSPLDKCRVLANTLAPFRLPAIGAPGQDATKTRQRRRWWPSQRYAKYFAHILFRAGFHLYTLPQTLWQGLCWWLGQRRLMKRA